MINTKALVNGYLNKSDWRVNENSNAPFSFGALGKLMIHDVSKDYWLNEVYTPDVAAAHNQGFYHIHDLGGLTLYCCGFSLRDVLMKGVRGVPNIPTSAPANHFASIINQLANLTTVFQNEIMGAVAFSSVDTLLAPFIKIDKLSYAQVRQNVQNLVFSINSNSRGGAEPAFTNFSMDITPPYDLLDNPAIVGGEIQDFTYGDCQEEMNLFNKAFCEVMLEGDALGEPFAYPIPTYNIHPRFDWDNPNNELLWEMAGKFGYPYFGNFINSDMDISDVRSMCCHLRLDLRELRKKTGGLFGSGDNTGSIGVVTINLPRIAYIAQDKTAFFLLLSHYMDLAKESLEIKRSFLEEQVLGKKLIPAFLEYVGDLNSHFSTIGNIGMNEMCENFLGKDIRDPEAIDFCREVLEFMRDRLEQYQLETGHLYNLEATPAESTCYALAKKDKEAFPDIITQGSGDSVFYTNSCRLPVQYIENIEQEAKHQSDLQTLYTGGTAEHFYLEHSISGAKAKDIVRHVLTTTKIPYISLSPLTKFCPDHKYVRTNGNTCPHCGKVVTMRQRVTGYIRNVDFFNKGKKAEFKLRKQLEV